MRSSEAHSERSNNLIHAKSRKLPKARSHNDLRDSLIALGDRNRSRKRQLAKLHRAGWPWRLPARAPTDPDVRALAHPVPRTDRFAIHGWSPWLSDRLTLTCLRTSMCSTCFPQSSLPTDASLSSTGSSRASSPASTVLSKRYDALQPSRRTSFPSLGGTSDALAVFAPGRTSAPPRPGVGHPVTPAGNSPRSEQGSPKFLGNHDCPFAHDPIRRRQDCLHQTVHSAAAWPLFIERQRLPRLGLSALNSIAFGLAVYASQDGLPRRHARLASGRWSGATGRAFHPQDSDERFQICFLTFHPPFPSFLPQSHRPPQRNCTDDPCQKWFLSRDCLLQSDQWE